MARAFRILFAAAYYHVTCRGNERKAIFRDDTDRATFVDKLKASGEIYSVWVHALGADGRKRLRDRAAGDKRLRSALEEIQMGLVNQR